MIVTRFEGRLGNQLFQYATGRCLSYKHNTELKIDIMLARIDFRESFYKLKNFNVVENFATPNDIHSLKLIKESQVKNVDEIINAPDNVYLHGYWQNEKYFSEIRDILLREMTLKNPLSKISALWKEKILSSTCAVSVHVRHGDYTTYGARNSFGVLSTEYYFDCVEELKKTFSDITIFVFSDDIQWCKSNLNFDVPTEFVEGCEYDFEELYLMSCCKHNVVANSTFSWWGAWLNPNPNKKVFTPDPWGFKNKRGARDLPETWIRMPAEYFSDMPPLLSVIVYVENNSPQNNLSLSSIIGQEYKDYEVILIDASSSGNEEIRQRFGGYKNVTILTTGSHTKKFSAWNKALEVARGDYVSFLATKEFLFPNTVKLLSDVSSILFGNSSYLNPSEKIPQIICATQRLEEDANGNSVIKNLPDKKFSVRTEHSFENLKTFVELKISNDQKLMALATKNINSLVGTKFFKRQFLKDNKIQFPVKGGADGELLFVINALLQAEKITFVPSVFYGRLK